MTPMDDAAAMATMTAILADHERWVARYQAPDVDETGQDGALEQPMPQDDQEASHDPA